MKKSILPILTYLFASTAIAIAASTPPVFQMRLVLDTAASDSEPMTYVAHYQNHTHTNLLYVQKAILLDETALKSAKLGTAGLGWPVIEITFTDAGAKRFAEVTRQNIHKRLAIVIDGQLCEAPIIQTEISGGKAQISGSFSKKEAKDLAKKISDALPK